MLFGAYFPPVDESINLPIAVFTNISNQGYPVESISWAISSDRIKSYLSSGFPWINWKVPVEFYDLDDYGSNFILLGDPYAVSLPISKINVGEDNDVEVTTAISPTDLYEGSMFNKVIYTIIKPFVSYSNIMIFSDKQKGS